jgi:hypothetical protein
MTQSLELLWAATKAARQHPLKAHWAIAKDFGIPDATLYRWVNAPRASLNPRYRFRVPMNSKTIPHTLHPPAGRGTRAWGGPKEQEDADPG